MIPEELAAAIDAEVPAGVSHIGFVPGDINGRFLISEPNGHPYGVSATFSKVKLQNGEAPSAALVRCLREQVGQPVCSVYPIPKVWVTPNSTSFYFAGLIRDVPEGVQSSTASLRWYSDDKAWAVLSGSQNPTTRQRDQALLVSVQKMCLSPYHNILLMLQELHRMGFERLRAYCYIYALGTWRCEIIPASWMSNQSRMPPELSPFELRNRLEGLLGIDNLVHFYTSANEQRVFQSDESVFLSPRELAKRYLREYPVVAAAGYGPDQEYVEWYNHILELLAPNGVFYAFAEFKEPTDYLYTEMARVGTVPLPPPGSLDAAEWQRFQARFRSDNE